MRVFTLFINWLKSLTNLVLKFRSRRHSVEKIVNRYQSYLHSRLAKVRILGDPIERDLTQVFVHLSVIRQESVEYSELLTMMDPHQRRTLNPFSAAETNNSFESPRAEQIVKPHDLLRQNSQAIIAGAPGCGKTTLLKYLALQAMQTRLVVWLELKAIDKSLLQVAQTSAAETGNLLLLELWLIYVKSQLTLTEIDEELLRTYYRERFSAGEVIFLLDGFDELQDEDIEKGINKCLQQYTSAFHHNSLLISTRPYAQHKLGTEGFQELQIEPLNELQVRSFFDSYYPNDPVTYQLLESIPSNSGVRELFHVPLLLGLILRLYRANKFVDDRLQLYELVITELIHELDRSKSVIRQFKIKDDRLRADFLQDLAFQRLIRDPLHTEPNQSRLVFTFGLLIERAKSFLSQRNLSYNPRDLADDALATPLLREVRRDLVAFTQLTLQEYLAARALAQFHARNEIDGTRLLCASYHETPISEMEVLPMMLGASAKADTLYTELANWSESLTLGSLRLRIKGLGYGAALSESEHTRFLERIWEVINPTNNEDGYRRMILRTLFVLPERSRHFLETKTIPYLRQTSGFSSLRAMEALEVIGGLASFNPIVETLSRRGRRDDGVLHFGSWQGLDSSLLYHASRALIRIDSQRAVEVLARVRTHYSYGDLDRLLKQVGTDKAYRAILSRQQGHATIDWHTSRTLNEILRQSENRSIIEVLLEALKNSTRPEVRRFAIDTLGIIGSPETASPIAEHLTDPDFATRWKAAQALQYIGSEEPLEPLIQALSDEADTVRWCSAMALGQIRSTKAVEGLIKSLSDHDAEVQYHAASALGWIADERAARPLATLLTSSASPKARSAAAYALYRIRTKDVIDTLMNALNDHHADVRAGAALALAGQESAAAVDRLLSCLNDPSEDVRANAAVALGRLRAQKAVPFLTAVLKRDQSSRARERIISALGEIGSPEVVGPLLSLSSSFDRSYVLEALANIKTSTLAEALPSLLNEQNKIVRLKAIEAVSYYSTDLNILNTLSSVAKLDPSISVATAAARAEKELTRKLELLAVLGNDVYDQNSLDNENRADILVGEVLTITAQAGHIFRPITNNDWGIDGEIEFKVEGKATGKRLYLQLKSGDSHLHLRKSDNKEIFTIKKPRHAEYWQQQVFPVMLVIRNSLGVIRWMNVTDYLKQHGGIVTQIEFSGEPFTVGAINRLCQNS